jgi:Sigma-70, region 4
VSSLENLPPDLRAVLSLLLRQRQSYAAIAGMLGIHERAVHDRAHAALALLAPREARELTAAQREEVGEFLLGRQTLERAHGTWTMLEGSPSAQAWARALAGELAPLAADPLPAIPEGPHATSAAAPQIPPRDPAEPAPARLPISRRGGAIVLGVLAAVVIAGVVLIVGVAGDGSGSNEKTGSNASSTGSAQTTSTSASSSTGTTSSTSAKGSKPKIGKPLQMTPPEPGTSKAVGVAYVLTQGSKRAFYLIAQSLAPAPSGGFYAVWLENSPTEAVPLGSLPALSSAGHTEGGGALPSNAGDYSHIVVTLQTGSHPVHPGTVALSGPFTLG